MDTINLINQLFIQKNIIKINHLLAKELDIDLFFNYYMSQQKINWGVVELIIKSGVCLEKMSEHRKDYTNYQLLFEYSIEKGYFEKISSFLMFEHFSNLSILEKICITFNYNSKKALKYLTLLYQKTNLFIQFPIECLNLIVSENHFDMLRWVYNQGFKEDINVIKIPYQHCYWQNKNVCALVECIENKENKVFLKKLQYLESLGLIINPDDSIFLNAVGYLDDLTTYKYLEKKGVKFKNKEDKKNIITDIVMNNGIKVIKYLVQKNELYLDEFQPFDYHKFSQGNQLKYELDYLAHACLFHNKKNKHMLEFFINQGYNWEKQQKAILEYISTLNLSLISPLLEYLFSLGIYSEDENSICKHTESGKAILDYLNIKNIEKEREKLFTLTTNKAGKTIKI